MSKLKVYDLAIRSYLGKTRPGQRSHAGLASELIEEDANLEREYSFSSLSGEVITNKTKEKGKANSGVEEKTNTAGGELQPKTYTKAHLQSAQDRLQMRCWSCGIGFHDSPDCPNKKAGHDDSCNWIDSKGGSNEVNHYLPAKRSKDDRYARGGQMNGRSGRGAGRGNSRGGGRGNGKGALHHPPAGAHAAEDSD